MRAVVYHGRRDVRVEDVSERSVGPGDVRVDVAACGICGSDLHEYAEGPITIPTDEPHHASGERAPLVVGHEFAGRVREVGETVEEFAPGDPVTVCPGTACGECRYCADGQYALCDRFVAFGLHSRGGMAESVVVPKSTVVPLPEGLPVADAALVEPLAVSLHAVRRSAFEPGDSAAVFGAGPIGLGVVQVLLEGGASEVFVSEPRAGRREVAESLGATVVDPSSERVLRAVKGATGGGVDVSFEAAGVEPSFVDAVRATKKRGNVTVVSVFEGSVSFQPNLLMMAERTLTGAFCYEAGPKARTGEFGAVIRMLADGRLQADPLVSDRVPIEEAPEAFEALLDPRGELVKVLVEP
ncbi:2,3-butanediol dehydrogenase [Halomarina litorea]|uniref:2,3-butanediol dehydrogenase n=1 Tax=Halomarina litorea TaxID=2961595 RepID=UPI0020C4CFA6|nr:2,3-butanediol dehydrogenase [Halomarina sp. BCD28]